MENRTVALNEKKKMTTTMKLQEQQVGEEEGPDDRLAQVQHDKFSTDGNEPGDEGRELFD